MGTRNLTIVKLNNEIKLAQYCQWDGYPTGQGLTIAEFLQNKINLRVFKKNVKALKWAPKGFVDELYRKAGAKDGMISFPNADKVKKSHPQFHRDTGANILGLIQDGKIKEVENEIDFLKDGLFCEFAYELDLDKKVVNVYVRGKKLVKTIKFKDFTPKSMTALQKDLNP